MTKPDDRKAEGKDRAEVRPRQPEDADDLDAEIVRDLEVGEEASDIRGGCSCGTSATHPT
jgi:hypothetical protein